MLHIASPIASLYNLVACILDVLLHILISSSAMTRELLPLHNDFRVRHRFEVRLRKQMLRRERLETQMLVRQPKCSEV